MLASVGYGDWKHVPRDLARNESSNKHLSYLLTYRISLEEQKTSRIKNRPLIIIEPQAHKKLNPSLHKGVDGLKSLGTPTLDQGYTTQNWCWTNLIGMYITCGPM